MISTEEVADTLKKINKAAIIQLTEGNCQKALELFEQSKAIEEKFHLKVQQAESLANIANIYMIMQKYDEAIQNLQEALVIFKEEKKNLDVLKINQTLGAVYVQIKNYNSAVQIFNECLKTSTQDNDKAYAYYYLGLCSYKLNDKAKAQNFYGNALTLFEKTENTDGIINCLYQRAKLFSQSRKDIAVQDLRKCLSLLAEKPEPNEAFMEKINRKIQELSA